jgi:hypothetical protein
LLWNIFLRRINDLSNTQENTPYESIILPDSPSTDCATHHYGFEKTYPIDPPCLFVAITTDVATNDLNQDQLVPVGLLLGMPGFTHSSSHKPHLDSRPRDSMTYFRPSAAAITNDLTLGGYPVRLILPN